MSSLCINSYRFHFYNIKQTQHCVKPFYNLLPDTKTIYANPHLNLQRVIAAVEAGVVLLRFSLRAVGDVRSEVGRRTEAEAVDQRVGGRR